MTKAETMPAPAIHACLYTWNATMNVDVQATFDNAKVFIRWAVWLLMLAICTQDWLQSSIQLQSNIDEV